MVPSSRKDIIIDLNPTPPRMRGRGRPLANECDNEKESDLEDLSGVDRDTIEAKNDFWTIPGDCVLRHHVVPRQTCTYVEGISQYHYDMWDVDRQTITSLDAITREKHQMTTWTGLEKIILRPFDWSAKIRNIRQLSTKRIHLGGTSIDKEMRNDETWTLLGGTVVVLIEKLAVRRPKILETKTSNVGSCKSTARDLLCSIGWSGIRGHHEKCWTLAGT